MSNNLEAWAIEWYFSLPWWKRIFKTLSTEQLNKPCKFIKTICTGLDTVSEFIELTPLQYEILVFISRKHGLDYAISLFNNTIARTDEPKHY